MIIAIAGFAGSGKTTLGRVLAEKLNYALVSPSFKDLANKEGISLMEFQRKAEQDKNVDLKFDAYVKSEASKGNCVVTTWLAPWMVDANIRVWLFAPLEVRAKRVAARDGLTVPEATKHIRERENQNRRRYLKLYKVDIFDTSGFDICFNSSKFTTDEMAEIVMKLIEVKKKR